MTARCPLCGGGCARRLVRGRHAIFRCEACDFEFVDPVPDAATLARVYDAGYFTGDATRGYADYFGAERAAADVKAHARLTRLVELGAKPGGAALDVGCADGRFLLAAQSRGFRAHGVEVSAEARAALPVALRETVHASIDAARTHGPYDVLTLWDVLEHLPTPPRASLDALRPLLAPGALLGLVVPVIDNLNARRWPRTWDQYKPPEHLWYFSRRALREAVTRALPGARVLTVECAWRREARAVEVLAGRWSDQTRVGRAVRGVERAAWRLLERRGVVCAPDLEDAVLLVAEVP